MNAIELSPMTLRDVPFFNAVRNASREWLHNQSSHTLQQAAEWFLRTTPGYLIILLDGLPIGYCRVTPGRTEAERTVGMDLHPDYRGLGLARPTYATLFAHLEIQGVTKYRLWVLKRNERARHIYDSLGFQVVTENEDEVEMAMVPREVG